MWLNLALVQGNESGKEIIEKLVQQMSREQIAEAQKLAREWQEKHRSEAN